MTYPWETAERSYHVLLPCSRLLRPPLWSELAGHVPGKQNLIRRAGQSGMYTNKVVQVMPSSTS
jgi:hypothetical protein